MVYVDCYHFVLGPIVIFVLGPIWNLDDCGICGL